MFDLARLRSAAADAARVDARARSADELLAAARELEAVRRDLDLARAHVLAALDTTGATEARTGLRTPGWVARETGQDERPLRRHVRLARRLPELGDTETALAAGRISWDHVAVIDRAANPRITERLVELVPELVVLAERLPFPVWAREVAAIAEHLDADGGHRPDTDRNRLRLTTVGDELHLDGRFSGEAALELRGLLDSAADRLFRRHRDTQRLDPNAQFPARPALLADALLELARGGAAVDLHSSTPARPDVTVVVHPDGRATLPDGTTLRGRLLDALLARCHHLHQVDLDHHGAATGPASPLADIDPHSEVGQVIARALGIDPDDRGPRYANRDLRRAAAARDGGCVVPGCGMPIAWCDLHHVIHWEHGGPTIIENLAPLCRFHHGLVHRLGWTMVATDDQWFWFQTPGGQRFWSQRHGIQRTGPPPTGAPPTGPPGSDDAVLAC